MSPPSPAPEHPLASAAVRDQPSAAFFDAAREGRLLILGCHTCGNHLAADSRSCSSCGGSDVFPTFASGRGNVVSWTVLEGRPDPRGHIPEPLVGGLIELEEGPWVPARLLVQPDDVTVGLRVTVVFVRSGEEAVPCFVDAASPSLVHVDEL